MYFEQGNCIMTIIYIVHYIHYTPRYRGSSNGVQLEQVYCLVHGILQTLEGNGLLPGRKLGKKLGQKRLSGFVGVDGH